MVEAGHPESPPRDASPARLPLLSILVRSIGRECLAQALASVGLQTYQRIEVVVVSARPGHPPLPPAGRFPVRLVETGEALPRSRAANEALRSAIGDYLLFLDDDDWLMPSHVERLADVLRQQPGALAAYTGISLVDADGRPHGQAMDLPYDHVRLLAGNLMPIHAVMFHRRLVDEGVRFDEALDRFEDWDFWLQVASRTPMVHLPGVSAAYRLHASSGVHEETGPAGEAARRIHAKWRSSYTPTQVAAVMERNWHALGLQRELESARTQAEAAAAAHFQREADLAARVRAASEALAQAHAAMDALRADAAQQLQAARSECQAAQAARDEAGSALAAARTEAARMEQSFLASRSWRITAPLRWAANRLRPRQPSAQQPPPSPGGGLPAAPQPRPTGMLDLLERALRYRRTHGTRATAREILRRLRRPQAGPGTPPAAPQPAAPPAQPVPRTAGGWVSGKDLAQAQYPQMRPLRVYTLPGTDSPRVSMVTDSINPGNLYGGVGTAILLTCLLAQARGGRARIITRVHEAAPAALANLLSTYGIKLGHEVEFVFAHHDSPREFDILADELFVTTSWWTTAATLGSIPGQRVIYLLQEDERMFYPWGDGHRRCASVLASHEPRYAINSRLLYDHLVASGLGHLRERGTWFEPAFPPSVFHPRQPLHADRRTLMFYARPLNERNLFYFGLEILEKALATGVLDPDAWRIVFVGKDIPEVRLLGGTVTVQRMENLGWSDYAALVGSVDLGLSLMYTPHPSYPPLDLAASGAVAVTNRCGNKQDLSAYSRNIVCGDMELDAMVEALREGVRLACNAQERAANHAQIRFATDWKQALQPLVEQFRSAG